MKCPNCGQNNADNAIYCENCGTRIVPQETNEQNTQASNNANTNPQSGNNAQFTQNVQNTQSNIPQNTNVNINNNNNYFSAKNIALCIVLTFITCGIYGFYWLYCLNEDSKKAANDVNAADGVVVILLSIITCGIYQWYWMYKQGERIDTAKEMRGISSENSGVIYLILSIVGLGIISYALMQNELNQMAKNN